MYKVFAMKENLTAQECLRQCKLCVRECVCDEEGTRCPPPVPLNNTTCCTHLKELEREQRATCLIFPLLQDPARPFHLPPLTEETRGSEQEPINAD